LTSCGSLATCDAGGCLRCGNDNDAMSDVDAGDRVGVEQADVHSR